MTRRPATIVSSCSSRSSGTPRRRGGSRRGVAVLDEVGQYRLHLGDDGGTEIVTRHGAQACGSVSTGKSVRRLPEDGRGRSSSVTHLLQICLTAQTPYPSPRTCQAYSWGSSSFAPPTPPPTTQGGSPDDQAGGGSVGARRPRRLVMRPRRHVTAWAAPADATPAPARAVIGA